MTNLKHVMHTLLCVI